MYHLVIVDDEEMTRHGLVHLFDWEKLGIEVVGEAENGLAALPILQTLRPDILFTDVKMPHMDGIQLASRMREVLPELKIVFISGYSEVEYIRSALKIGAIEYILKPVEYPELEQCFQKVIRQIENERLAQRTLEKMQDRLNTSLPTLKEHFLALCLRGQIPVGEKLQTQLEYFKITRDQPLFTVVLIFSPDEGAVDSCAGFQNNWPLLSVALKNITDEILQEHFVGGVIDDPFVQKQLSIIAFFDQTQTSFECLYEIAVRMQETVKKYLGLCVSVSIGKTVNSLRNLKASYTSAAEALKHRLYIGGECIIPYNFNLESNPVSLADSTPAGSLKLLLLDKSEEKLECWITELFNSLAKMCSIDITFYRGRVSRYVFEAHGVLCEQLGTGEEGELGQQPILDQLFNAETLEQMRELLWQYCKSIRNLIQLKNDAGTKGLIRQVQKVIREQYNENTTVNELAESVYLTPTYLCLLFRQVTGTTINHYQTQVRMEKAKELLLDLSNKLYDVSYAVGYMNPSYFSRQFKKYTGCLPSEYRDRKIAGKE